MALGNGAPGPSDAADVLRAAATSSTDAMTPRQSQDALRGFGCVFGDLQLTLRRLGEVCLDADVRRACMSYVEPSCDASIDALSHVPAPVRLLWAYVVVLARHCVEREAGLVEQAEDLATLRLGTRPKVTSGRKTAA